MEYPEFGTEEEKIEELEEEYNLSNIPIENLYLICEQLEDKDLLKLIRTNKEIGAVCQQVLNRKYFRESTGKNISEELSRELYEEISKSEITPMDGFMFEGELYLSYIDSNYPGRVQNRPCWSFSKSTLLSMIRQLGFGIPPKIKHEKLCKLLRQLMLRKGLIHEITLNELLKLQARKIEIKEYSIRKRREEERRRKYG